MDDIKDGAKGGFRRVELLTGPGRRRQWTAAEKARIVAESLAPGAVVSEVARHWQVCPQQVFGWRREARAGLLALPSDVAGPAELAFVPIVAEPAPPPPVEAAAAVPSAPAIEVEIAGAVVRVVPGTDGALLTAVLRAVRASAPPA
jgi:transposase